MHIKPKRDRTFQEVKNGHAARRQALRNKIKHSEEGNIKSITQAKWFTPLFAPDFQCPTAQYAVIWRGEQICVGCGRPIQNHPESSTAHSYLNELKQHRINLCTPKEIIDKNTGNVAAAAQAPPQEVPEEMSEDEAIPMADPILEVVETKPQLQKLTENALRMHDGSHTNSTRSGSEDGSSVSSRSSASSTSTKSSVTAPVTTPLSGTFLSMESLRKLFYKAGGWFMDIASLSTTTRIIPFSKDNRTLS